VAEPGRNLEFGASIVPLAEPPDLAASLAVAVEEAGLDLVGIQDHPYHSGGSWTPGP
jgi:alkanesulfonate monooxygenase SsuD/methylene tetrahydromethanopterin reductase-like flavin-dependent oxidoreductase (luciferase family)